MTPRNNSPQAHLISEDDDDEDNPFDQLGVDVAFGTILGAGLKGSEGPLVFRRTCSVVAHERGLKRAREEYERAREEWEQSQSFSTPNRSSRRRRTGGRALWPPHTV